MRKREIAKRLEDLERSLGIHAEDIAIRNTALIHSLDHDRVNRAWEIIKDLPYRGGPFSVIDIVSAWNAAGREAKR